MCNTTHTKLKIHTFLINIWFCVCLIVPMYTQANVWTCEAECFSSHTAWMLILLYWRILYIVLRSPFVHCYCGAVLVLQFYESMSKWGQLSEIFQHVIYITTTNTDDNVCLFITYLLLNPGLLYVTSIKPYPTPHNAVNQLISVQKTEEKSSLDFLYN